MSASSGKHDEYLITTTADGRSYQWVWDAHEPLSLDRPNTWEIVRQSDGVKLVHVDAKKEIDVRASHLAGERGLEIPAVGDSRPMLIEFKKLKRIRPAYLPDLDAIQKVGKAEHYVSAGIREHLISFQALDSKMTCQVEQDGIFQASPVATGLQITAKRAGLKFKPHGEDSIALPPGQTFAIQFSDVYTGAFIFGSYWWRFNRVATPEMVDLDELDKEEASQDLVSLQQLGKVLAGFMAVSVAVIMGVRWMQDYQDAHRKKPETAQVEMKKPKYIPIAEKPKPSPTPPQVAKKPEPKKPEPKKPEPPKVAKKKPEPPKVAKKPEPKKPEPPKVAKKPEPPKPAAPVKVAQKAPVAPPAPPAPAKPQPVAPKAPDPSVVAAQQKAAVAKSLNFLSTGPSKNVNALATAPGAKLSQKYANTGSGALPASQSELNKMAVSNTGSGPIQTSSSRVIASNSGIKGGHGKGLNQVQGKVSLNALYGSGSGESLAGAMGGGMSVSGPGKLSDAEIEKTLAKYLQKLQFCYEKALLADSNLGGTVQIQWTITTSGSVTGQAVTRTEINHSGMKDCLMREFGKMQFPRPKGGDVVVKKPFKFEASSM